MSNIEVFLRKGSSFRIIWDKRHWLKNGKFLQDIIDSTMKKNNVLRLNQKNHG